MATVNDRTKSHNHALCAELCAQFAQHPIRVCGLCLCGVRCWMYRLAACLVDFAKYF